MRVLVFGGAGFLGSHTADNLSETGYDVTIFDLKKSKYLQKNQKMIVGNVLNKKLVENTIKNADIVYNFSGIADMETAKNHPIKTVEINILGNSLILEACKKYNIKRYIFASSIYVYSEMGSFYRASKQACELIIECYNKEFGLPFTILRYGSLYGPRAQEWNGVYKLIKQAIEEGKIEFEGSGEELREFIHVYDAAKLSVKILDKKYENQYFILTGHEKMKFKDFITMIGEIMNRKINVQFNKNPDNIRYIITPYNYSPRVAKKLVSTEYHDIGQGMLQCINEIYDKSDTSNK